MLGLAEIRRGGCGSGCFFFKHRIKNIKGVKSMKMKGGFFGLVVIVFALTFIGSGDVGATNCYDLYYNETCSDYDWENWDYVKLAMHKDKSWEVRTAPYSSNALAGDWNVFGNAIRFSVAFAIGDGSIPVWFQDVPLLAGVKTGQAKLLEDPYKSKANISKGQGFFRYYATVGCWYLKKVKNDQCPWIAE